MFTTAGMLFFYCETPLHAGSGSNISHVDLPLQRERHTDYPIVQASGVKGACRDWAESLYRDQAEKMAEITFVFGPEDNKASDHSGTVAFTDAQILLFPVRSFVGGFAWLTCPRVLDRLRRKLAMINATEGLWPEIAAVGPAEGQVWASNRCRLLHNDLIILEDLAVQVDRAGEQVVQDLADWLAQQALPQSSAYAYIRQRLPESLLVVANDLFQDFVRLSTEIVTRIRIGETGTVETGALWSQELLLTDTVLYSLVLAKDLKVNGRHQKAEASLQFIADLVQAGKILQMGGDETVGRGLVRPHFWIPTSQGGAA